jgi:hypothetical protein
MAAISSNNLLIGCYYAAYIRYSGKEHTIENRLRKFTDNPFSIVKSGHASVRSSLSISALPAAQGNTGEGLGPCGKEVIGHRSRRV